MKLEEFLAKRKNIATTHPAPKGFSEKERIRFWSKIAQSWIDELDNIDDVKTAQKEERDLITSTFYK